MDEATGAFFGLLGRRKRVVDRPRILGSRRNPGGIYWFGVVFRAPRSPFARRELLASASVLFCGHFCALGVQFFDGVLAFAPPLSVLGVGGPGFDSSLFFRHEVGG